MIEPFDYLYLAGQDLYLRIYNAAGQVFDFDDNTFKALSSATTPYSVSTEQTDVGGAGESGYLSNVELSDINATSTRFPIRWMFFNNANPQSSDRGVSAMMSGVVVNGQLLVEATAVVSGTVDVASFTAAAKGQMRGIGVLIPSEVPPGTDIEILYGDDQDLVFAGDEEDQWPDLTGATITMKIENCDETTVVYSGTPTTPTGMQVVTVALTKDTSKVAIKRWTYAVKATLSNGDVRTLSRGNATVLRTYED